MIIRSIHIVRFGKLEELSISFDPKLHIIEGGTHGFGKKHDVIAIAHLRRFAERNAK